MKGAFFNKPLEWNIDIQGEAWQQGTCITGVVKVKNLGAEAADISNAGVALAHADIKKVHTRKDGALKLESQKTFEATSLAPAQTMELSFSLPLGANCAVTDKRSSYYITYGRDFNESHLMLKIEPRALYGKLIGLLDTFQRFKVKEYKSGKHGVEYKLIPPTSRDMANVESLALTFAMKEDQLHLSFDFQVKKLDTTAVVTKVNKESTRIDRALTPKEYSLGRDMINQDQLLKTFEGVMAEVKLKSVF